MFFFSGAIAVAKYSIPHLTESLGNIVNVSSCLGVVASYTTIAYSMTKAGLNHFTKCLAIGLAGKGIRVNAITLVKHSNFIQKIQFDALV